MATVSTSRDSACSLSLSNSASAAAFPQVFRNLRFKLIELILRGSNGVRADWYTLSLTPKRIHP